ncbi:phage capsid protein [Roseibium sp.]|uniref:phage capsid protein n=1 Tax=Roseibium sp. TaxID=1936156 RepID=UPI003D0B3ED5
MSTSIDTAFITSYEAKVHEVFQRRGSYLKEAVRQKTDVVGSTAVFQKIGKGVATTKARHGTITPMNQTHTAPSCTLADFYAGDWVDALDEAKININERDALASGGAMALGRKVDDQITTVLDTTTQTSITITVSSKANILAGAVTFAEAAWDNDVPNDGMVYAVITSRLWSQFMTLDQFMNADYVRADGQAYTTGPAIGGGKWKDWMGIKWKMQTGLPGAGTATAKGFIWHQTAIGYASAKHAKNVAANEAVAADITWHGDRAAHFVNHMMSGQACLIDDTGVIESNHNDTTAVATS